MPPPCCPLSGLLVTLHHRRSKLKCISRLSFIGDLPPTPLPFPSPPSSLPFLPYLGIKYEGHIRIRAVPPPGHRVGGDALDYGAHVDALSQLITRSLCEGEEGEL